MIIDRFVPYRGEHCETTAFGNLLQHTGIRLSEPILFGIGEGLGFIYWDQKGMELPFIGGRVKPDELTSCAASHLNLKLEVQETSSVTKAWSNIKEKLDRGIPVGLKLDSYHLDYFNNKVHFAGHYAAIYGYDDEYAYMADTAQQGSRTQTRLSTLSLARNEKGPMSSRNLSYTIEPPSALPELTSILRTAISRNAYKYLNPPIRNIGNKGIDKMSKEVLKWPARGSDLADSLCLTALLMERGGTGGALFRNLYRDFLKESYELLNEPRIQQAYLRFTEIAPAWSEVAASIGNAGKTGDEDWLRQTSKILKEIAIKEKEAMELLLEF